MVQRTVRTLYPGGEQGEQGDRLTGRKIQVCTRCAQAGVGMPVAGPGEKSQSWLDYINKPWNLSKKQLSRVGPLSMCPPAHDTDVNTVTVPCQAPRVKL